MVNLLKIFFKYISVCFVLIPTEMEECQQSENAPAVESGHLVAEQQPRFLRSSSTPDVTEPPCSESAQGMELQSLTQNCSLAGKELHVAVLSTFILTLFQRNLLFKFYCKAVISGIKVFSLFISKIYLY